MSDSLIDRLRKVRNGPGPKTKGLIALLDEAAAAAAALAAKDAVIARLESELDAAQTNWSNETLELGAEIEKWQKLCSQQHGSEHELHGKVLKQQALIEALTKEIQNAKSALLGDAGGNVALKCLHRALNAKVEALLEQQNETTD